MTTNAKNDAETKPHLIFRYHYSVREVWGPYPTRGEAQTNMEDLFRKDPKRDPREYAIKEIDHPPPVRARAISDNPQVAVDSGLNYWAMQLLVESAQKSEVFKELREMSFVIGDLYVRVGPKDEVTK